MKRLILAILSAFSCVSLAAQFMVGGSDPSGIRWMQAETPEFRIIYPAGEDSLARVYGSWLEKSRISVSRSSGLMTGMAYKAKMPVILHSFSAISNATVAWAPKRLDIYTTPDPYHPTPIPWEKMLAIHEGRHIAQMQFGALGRYRFLNHLVGEMAVGALAGIYPGPTFLEGDAVVAETALTASGRGRQASFLSYMMPAFECGDWRDYWQWSYGSRKYYAPDYYRTGYLLISGMRVFFDDPTFTKDYFDRARGKGMFFLLQKTVKEASGMGFRKAFREIEGRYDGIWQEEARLREPFMPARQVTEAERRHVSYSGSVFSDDSGIWSLRAGLTRPCSLVRLDGNGSVLKAVPFSVSSSDLFTDDLGKRIWWSENIPDKRWPRAGSSRIRFIDTANPSSVRELNIKGNFFNPAPSPDGRLVCVTEYPSSGGSRLLVLDGSDGTVLDTVDAPDSLQFTESAWIGECLFVAGLSDHGMGLYSVGIPSEPQLGVIIAPRPAEMAHLRSSSLSKGRFLSFLSDRTGVDELYLLDPDSGELFQATSTRYGIGSPFFGPGADTLYYSSLAPSDRPEAYRQGNMIYATAVRDLPMKPVYPGKVHGYVVADALTSQEKELAGNGWEDKEEYSPATLSEPRRFRRIVPNLHSWAPVYFNYDNVDNLSGDEYYKTASLGATALFQNLSGDGYGFVGYSAHESPEGDPGWRHSAHFKYLYTGLWPAIEVSADFSDRNAVEMRRVQLVDRTKKEVSLFTSKKDAGTPYFEGFARLYVPLSFKSGGITRGVIPQIRFKYTNDVFRDGISLREMYREKEGERETGILGQDRSSMLTTLDLSVRGYILRDKAPSQTYPKFGIGAEAGFHSRPGHSESFSNTAYLYTYGYLPGILQDQGLKITASFGANLGGGKYSYPDTPVSFIPRGFVDTSLKSVGNSCSPAKFKFTLDYAVPLINLDWSGLCPMAFVQNLQVTPFLDVSYQDFNYFSDYQINRYHVVSDTMASFGADLTVNLGNFLWIPYETTMGFRYARNVWKELERFPVSGLKHDYFGWIFSISM